MPGYIADCYKPKSQNMKIIWESQIIELEEITMLSIWIKKLLTQYIE
jgi:hypothetical protein